MQIVAALLMAAAAAHPEAPRGTLCFLSAKTRPVCQVTEGVSIRITPSEQERVYVWSSGDGKRAVLGVAPAKSAAVDLDDPALRDLTLSIRGDKNHGWPADLRVIVTGAGKKEWPWIVPAKQSEALSLLRVPSAKYQLAFGADHHLTDRRRTDATKNGSIGAVNLRPMPVISGRVVGPKDEPVANVQVVRTDRPTAIATTDEQGNFRGETGDPPPDSVFVEKPGFGSQLLPLKLTGDADLGVIRLGHSLKVTLRVVRPDSLRDPVQVTLLRISGFRYELVRIGSKELAPGDETVTFENLGSGKFAVLLEGKIPLEKQSDLVETKDTAVEKEIKIEPYRLDGTAKIGEDPIDGSIRVSLSQKEITLPITDGKFGGTLWQHGKLFAWFRTDDNSLTQVLNSPVLGADPSAWDIRFPKRFISGRIYDVDTKQPVPAEMQVMVTSGDTHLYVPVKSKDDGTFSLLATKSGKYELTVAPPDYVGRVEAIEVHDDDGSIQRDIPLTRGLPVTIEAVWASGAPVVNAQVLEGVASDGHNAEHYYRLDGNARLTVRLRRGESRTLYIVPRDGSFGIAHLVAPESDEASPVRVTVPAPAGSLRIGIKDSDGKGVSALIGMRFNGEVVPVPVIYQLPRPAGHGQSGVWELLQMPAGSYEIWPLSSRYIPMATPKSVGLSAGTVDVELTATKK